MLPCVHPCIHPCVHYNSCHMIMDEHKQNRLVLDRESRSVQQYEFWLVFVHLLNFMEQVDIFPIRGNLLFDLRKPDMRWY